EIRLLTILKEFRGRELAMLLMYAAFRWIESHGGNRVVAIGRSAILDLYLKVGLEPVGHSVQSGAVQYELLTSSVENLTISLARFSSLIARIEQDIDWKLSFPF